MNLRKRTVEQRRRQTLHGKPPPSGGGGGGLPHKNDGDTRRLALGCKLQILVSLEALRRKVTIFRPFRYGLGLCINKFTKNAVISVSISFPLGVSLSLSHTHIGLPYGFNFNFPTSIPVTFI